jgi:hypothetical protein
MNPLFLAVSLLSIDATAPSPVAALRVDGEASTFVVQVTGELSGDYQIAIDCTERCTRPVHYRETTSDTPLGLFSRDQNNLVFSTWSGGSAYRVMVWAIAGDNVRKVVELSSRGTPNFWSDAQGRPTIETYEGASVRKRPLRSLCHEGQLTSPFRTFRLPIATDTPSAAAVQDPRRYRLSSLRTAQCTPAIPLTERVTTMRISADISVGRS